MRVNDNVNAIIINYFSWRTSSQIELPAGHLAPQQSSVIYITALYFLFNADSAQSNAKLIWFLHK